MSSAVSVDDVAGRWCRLSGLRCGGDDALEQPFEVRGAVGPSRGDHDARGEPGKGPQARWRRALIRSLASLSRSARRSTCCLRACVKLTRSGLVRENVKPRIAPSSTYSGRPRCEHVDAVERAAIAGICWRAETGTRSDTLRAALPRARRRFGRASALSWATPQCRDRLQPASMCGRFDRLRDPRRW